MNICMISTSASSPAEGFARHARAMTYSEPIPPTTIANQ